MSDVRTKSAEWEPGTVLEWRGQDRVVLDRRKEQTTYGGNQPFWPGWWLRDDQGGLADFVIDAENSPWRVLSSPESTEPGGDE